MTLAEVAARMRAEGNGLLTSNAQAAWLEHAVLAFEADPDFKLRERVEALATEFEEYAVKGGQPIRGYERSGLMRDGTAGLTWSEVARRLRELKGAP